MQFEKKKSILRYLGKDGKDVRALDRLIKQWKVVYDWAYYSINGDGVEDETESEKRDDIENFLYNRESETSKVDKINQELEEARINAKYYEDLYNKEVANNQEIIRNMYRYVTKNLRLKVEWEQFRDFAVNWEEDCNY